jgi:hypothetical protein
VTVTNETYTAFQFIQPGRYVDAHSINRGVNLEQILTCRRQEARPIQDSLTWKDSSTGDALTLTYSFPNSGENNSAVITGNSDFNSHHSVSSKLEIDQTTFTANLRVTIRPK